MKILVNKMTMADYRELVTALGDEAEYVMVPGTVPDLQFQGVYIDKAKTKIAVPWPVERPMDAQKDFADAQCGGGFPVETIIKEVNREGLYLVEGNDLCH
jgi:hypothetical protein